MLPNDSIIIYFDTDSTFRTYIQGKKVTSHQNSAESTPTTYQQTHNNGFCMCTDVLCITWCPTSFNLA